MLVFAPTSLQFYNTFLSSNLVSSTAPLLLQLTTPSALASSASIKFKISADYVPAGSSTALMCTVRDSSFNPAVVVRCTFSTDTYTIAIPTEGLVAGSYIFKLTTRDQTTNGVIFSTAMSRQVLTVGMSDGSTTSGDIGYLSPAPTPFSTFSVQNWNSIADSQGYLIISLKLPAAISADLSTDENKLVIEFGADYYDAYLGASTTTFSAEGLSYNDGMAFPLIATSSLTGIQASLLYGYFPSTTPPTPSTPARIIIGSQSVSYPTSTITFKLPYIKNPSINNPMSITVYSLEYLNTPYPISSYRIDYPAYDIPIASTLTSPGSPSLNIPNFTPQQTTTVDFNNLKFSSALTTSYAVYIKFKNLAKGWNYASIIAGTITCSGYTNIDFFKNFYLMILTPDSNQGSTVSITGCTPFYTATYVQTPATFEVGRYSVGNSDLNTYTLSTAMTSQTSIPGTLTQSRASGDYDNPGSITKLTLTFSPTGTFIIPAGGYIQITYATSSSFLFPGVGRTECSVSGLKDLGGTATGPKKRFCYHDSANNRLIIKGYAAYNRPTDADIVVTYFMKNSNVDPIFINWNIYDANGNLFANTGNFAPQLDSSIVSPYGSLSGFTIPTYQQYPLPIYSGTTAPLILQFSLNTGISYNSGTIKLTLPSDFAFSTPGKQAYYYSTNGGTSFVPTTGTFASSVATINLNPSFTIPALTTTLLYITTEGSLNGEGVIYPTAPGLKVFTIKTVISGTETEAAYYEYILPPSESSGVTSNIYLTKTNYPTIVDAQFTMGTGMTASAGDQIEMLFRTSDDLNTLWPVDLGLTFSIERTETACSEIGGSTILSATKPIGCVAYKATSVGPNSYVKVAGKITKAIASGAKIWFLAANLITPSTSNAKAPIKIRLSTPCRFDNFPCPIFQSSFSYGTTYNNAIPGQETATKPTPSNAQVQATNVATTFSVALTTPVTATSAIVIKPDMSYYALPADCSSSAGSCANFPSIGWIFFQPTSTLSSTASFDSTLR